MEELFEESEVSSMSPRLKWMDENMVGVWKNEDEDDDFRAVVLDNKLQDALEVVMLKLENNDADSIGQGKTEELACESLIIKLGLKHWNEETDE